MTPIDSFRDKSGRDVRVGDWIAYGHNLGRCAGIRFGKVLGIQRAETGDTRTHNGFEWNKYAWKIKVRGIEDDRAFYDPKPCKPGTLMYPDRILLANDIIPEAYKRLLDEA